MWRLSVSDQEIKEIQALVSQIAWEIYSSPIPKGTLMLIVLRAGVAEEGGVLQTA